MTTIDEVAAHADEVLNSRSVPDYPSALNGLQIQNRSELRSIAAAVDLSTRSIEGTIAARANLLVVHHGMFWGGLSSLTGPAYRRVQLLIENDVAVYSSHIPLDCHPALGNNVLLAKELELKPSKEFARYQGIYIGVAGECEIATRTLVDRATSFARKYGHVTRTTRFDNGRRTHRWGMCSGAGASADTLQEAIDAGIDTLIVGEGPHWTAITAEENDLVVIYAGHYATETLGVCALSRHLSERYKVPWSFVSAPTGL
ncbi:MAG TPA: Nif3-like dinuclear metal center hexameric protein [Gemmatimonadaceae bacterium]|nr:Nif3-like dinuclear metal center hexameric protein [Gemmatimonadaceae bacterium]